MFRVVLHMAVDMYRVCTKMSPLVAALDASVVTYQFYLNTGPVLVALDSR